MLTGAFIALVAPLLAASAVAADSSQPEFGMPIDCHYGVNCYIQNYVDTDASGDHTDYRCGHLSYNGHTGTDFRVPGLKAMRSGVSVLAAADGVVRATRDGMLDISIRDGGKISIRDRECGNGVMLEHGNGWETQYCHLRNGSIRVKQGQSVKAGAAIGLVGLSGQTEFPHVHFAVRHNGRTLDPFTGLPSPEASSLASLTSSSCGDNPELEKNSLWNAATQQKLRYVGTALLGAGFSSTKPEAKAASEGEYDKSEISRNARMLTFWAELMGVEKGDKISLTLTSPTGEVLATHENEIASDKAQMFMFIGKRYTGAPPPAGTYHGKVVVARSSGSSTTTPVVEEMRNITIR